MVFSGKAAFLRILALIGLAVLLGGCAGMDTGTQSYEPMERDGGGGDGGGY